MNKLREEKERKNEEKLEIQGEREMTKKQKMHCKLKRINETEEGEHKGERGGKRRGGEEENEDEKDEEQGRKEGQEEELENCTNKEEEEKLGARRRKKVREGQEQEEWRATWVPHRAEEKKESPQRFPEEGRSEAGNKGVTVSQCVVLDVGKLEKNAAR